MGIVCSYREGSGRSHDRACVFVSLCPTSLRSVSRSQKQRTQTEGRTRSMKNRSGRVPRSPRASQNRAKIVNKSVQGAFGAILDDSGRLRDVLGMLRRRSVTLSGCSGTPPGTLPGRTLPEHSRDAPGCSSDTFGMSWDCFFAQLTRGSVFPSIRLRFSGHFPMVFRSFRRICFVRFALDFYIVF